jgi:uncharacterized protein (TIGR00255 family)
MACRSMTGFGQADVQTASIRVKVEMRSVNHRFSEFSIRLPREWAPWEAELRQRLAARISRGRVDVTVQADWTGLPGRVSVDWALLDDLVAAAREAALRYGESDQVVSSQDWLRFPGVVTVGMDAVPDEAREALWQAVDEALAALLAMREREGARLAEVMAGTLAELAAWVDRMAEAAPRSAEAYEARIRSRIAGSLGADGQESVDAQRVWTEVALFAERAAVDEELARLRSHIEEFRQALQADGPVGRRLDFLVQEMHREVNTIGAKSQDLDLSRAVVEAKVLIEKLREQAQNVE